VLFGAVMIVVGFLMLRQRRGGEEPDVHLDMESVARLAPRLIATGMTCCAASRCFCDVNGPNCAAPQTRTRRSNVVAALLISSRSAVLLAACHCDKPWCPFAEHAQQQWHSFRRLIHALQLCHALQMLRPCIGEQITDPQPRQRAPDLRSRYWPRVRWQLLHNNTMQPGVERSLFGTR